MPHHAAARFLGVRGMIMVVLGVRWILAGLAILAGSPIFTRSDETLFAHEWMPEWLRASMWIGTGTAAIVTAMMHRYEDKALGWLCIMPSIRAISYVGAWFIVQFWTGLGIEGPPPTYLLDDAVLLFFMNVSMVALVIASSMVPRNYVPDFARNTAEKPHRFLNWCAGKRLP